jgi:hypothetical protein
MKRCVTAFSTSDRTVAAGTLVEDGDEIVNGHEELFVDAGAEPQANVIPGTDKVGDNTQPDEPADDTDRREPDRRVHTQTTDAPVEQATAEPGEKRRTRRS